MSNYFAYASTHIQHSRIDRMTYNKHSCTHRNIHTYTHTHTQDARVRSKLSILEHIHKRTRTHRTPVYGATVDFGAGTVTASLSPDVLNNPGYTSQISAALLEAPRKILHIYVHFVHECACSDILGIHRKYLRLFLKLPVRSHIYTCTLCMNVHVQTSCVCIANICGFA